jgi:hypothetical protein
MFKEIKDRILTLVIGIILGCRRSALRGDYYLLQFEPTRSMDCSPPLTLADHYCIPVQITPLWQEGGGYFVVDE